MKKVILMLMLCAIAPAFAGQESDISYETVDDSTKQVKCYDKGDILISVGGGMFGSGAITLLASRRIGLSLMGVGGVLAVIGVGIKVGNSVKKKE